MKRGKAKGCYQPDSSRASTAQSSMKQSSLHT